ncbi:hypothetical protein PPYR_04771 [Photinus pyralis]|uniref:Myb-like domain-containing protein n=3 Tax=Photinus pyralis TaxID=7054 RepID=A0A1Y1LYJ7_PHOPY|nr:uncharacterized protein LOC116162777 [Photinus pyralis]KAB0802585.1 hypothetical protein PPYR_04771 [Photinus pyralis]
MDCDETNSSVVFYINGECVKIESDLEDIVKLKESDTFAANYIKMMVDNNFIEIPELKSIERLYEDGSISDIYNSQKEPEVLKAESEWGAPETELLLNKYNHYIRRVGLLDIFKTKKKMWMQIAEDIKAALKISKTETQCENRYKTIMKRKKKVGGVRFRVNRVSEEEGSCDILESIDDTMEIVRTDWSDPETKLLLHKYEQHSPMVGPMNKFKTCKQMWIKISEDINHILGVARTETQCENRFKAVMKKVEDPLCCDVPEVKLRAVEDSRACAVSQSVDDAELDATKSDLEWGGPETKLLLDKYEQYVFMVGSRFKTKKKMWAKISEDLKQILNVSKTDAQCENRYKTILRRKRRVDHNYHRAVDLRDDVKFEQELCKIVLSEEDSESEPVRCVCASKKIRNDPQRGRNRRKRRWVVPDAGTSKMRALMAFQKRMEVNRERRHREKMQMMEQLLQVLKS